MVWKELQLIGRGAQGSVHLVRGTGGALRVAKTVDTISLADREREAAHRECGLLRELCHENIVKYIESYAEGRSLILIMEWCQGGDLSRDILRERESKGRYSDGVILRWTAQMSDALRYIHERRVLHRDLKSSNVFLTKDQDVKLGDLGIAKILESTLADADSVVGTPQYLSPELCENRPYSFSSDVWALGCVVYELCALKRPFDASNLLGVVYCVVKANIDMQPLVKRPIEIKRIVSGLLTKKAEGRPSAIQVYQEAKNTCDRLGVDMSLGKHAFAQIDVNLLSPPQNTHNNNNTTTEDQPHFSGLRRHTITEDIHSAASGHYTSSHEPEERAFESAYHSDEHYEYDSFESDDETTIQKEPVPQSTTPPKHALSPAQNNFNARRPQPPRRRSASMDSGNAIQIDQRQQKKFLPQKNTSHRNTVLTSPPTQRPGAAQFIRKKPTHSNKKQIPPEEVYDFNKEGLRDHALLARRPHTVGTYADRHTDTQRTVAPRRRAATAGSIHGHGAQPLKLPGIQPPVRPQPSVKIPFQHTAALHEAKQKMKLENQHSGNDPIARNRSRPRVSNLSNVPSIHTAASAEAKAGFVVFDRSQRSAQTSTSDNEAGPRRTITPRTKLRQDWDSNLNFQAAAADSHNQNLALKAIDQRLMMPTHQRRYSFAGNADEFIAAAAAGKLQTHSRQSNTEDIGKDITARNYVKDDLALKKPQAEYVRGRLTAINPSLRKNDEYRRRATYAGSPPPPIEPPPPRHPQIEERFDKYRRQKSADHIIESQRQRALHNLDKATQLRERLGPRAFDALRDAFHLKYENGAKISRDYLLDIVGGTKDGYDLCMQVEQLVYRDYARTSS